MVRDANELLMLGLDPGICASATGVADEAKAWN
jgi:hypothetical protein